MTLLPPVLYVANVRLPSERAHAVQILSQVDALLALGVPVRILAPRRRGVAPADPEAARSAFGLERPPPIERAPSLDFIDRFPRRWQRLPFLVQSASFAWTALPRILRHRGVVYSRDPWTAVRLARRSRAPAWFFEVHQMPVRPAARAHFARALRHASGVVAITRGLVEDLVEIGVEPARIAHLPDAWSPRRFGEVPRRDDARARLAEAGVEWPPPPLVVYAGSLLPWKGVDTLVEAAALSERFSVVVVGGSDEERQRLGRRLPRGAAGRVLLHPAVEPARVSLFLAAADVVVVPNSGREQISARYTSPLKLFEAMASGRPIVASDLPSLREVLDERSAVLVPPDRPEALARGIERALRPEVAERIATVAHARAAEFTFAKRAERIVRFVRARLEAEGVS